MKLDTLLQEFASQADEWFAQHTFVQEHHRFFKEFSKSENLNKMEWPDIQKMGPHLHCFATNALAKTRAFGKPNHKIEYYRKSFADLINGKDSLEDRIVRFTSHKDYQLSYFGESSWSEIIGNLFAEDYVLMNSRTKFALETLGLPTDYLSKKRTFLEKLQRLNEIVEPIRKEFVAVAGKHTDCPINLEIDQFFSWIYENYQVEEDELVSGEHEQSYWTLAAGEDGFMWDQWKEQSFISIGWSELGDLSEYEDKDSLSKSYKVVFEPKKEPRNNVLACWEFVNALKIGDVVYVKNGIDSVLAKGRVTGDYSYRLGEQHPNRRAVEWLTVGPFELPEIKRFDIKALTDITPYEDFIAAIEGALKQPAKFSGTPTHASEDRGSTPNYETYNFDRLSSDSFIDDSRLREILAVLDRKKNIILQGPPGTGKTHVAKLLAYTLMGEKAEDRVELIQFHQSYSYEDFIQGFRPKAPNGFELKSGCFYNFVQKAIANQHQKFFFVIDEINRGNLSKIFGELMMLIEPDKRGKKYAMQLTYSQNSEDRFYIPENVHLIGTMNTADRSLSMVDYALRRRFSFFALKPEFESQKFANFMKSKNVPDTLVHQIKTRLVALNKRICAETKFLGEGFVIGHSYFCLPPNSDHLEWYDQVIRYEIEALLQEYWVDDIQKTSDCMRELLAG